MTTVAFAPRYHGRHSRARQGAFPRITVPSVGSGSTAAYAAAGVVAGSIAIGTALTVATAASASSASGVGALGAALLPEAAAAGQTPSGLLGSGIGEAFPAVAPDLSDLSDRTAAVVAPGGARSIVSTDGVLGFTAKPVPATARRAVTVAPVVGAVSRTTVRSSVHVSTGGLSAHAVAVIAAVRANFPQISSIGTFRGGGGDHGSGHACDIMTSNVSLGTAIAEYMRAHARELGITYVIWRQHVWSVARSSEGWRLMPDRGSTTANHYDHVHVSVS